MGTTAFVESADSVVSSRVAAPVVGQTNLSTRLSAVVSKQRRGRLVELGVITDKGRQIVLRIKMYPAGNGDAFLISSGGLNVLVDGGYGQTAKSDKLQRIINWLNKLQKIGASSNQKPSEEGLNTSKNCN